MTTRYMTVEEVAELLRLEPITVREWLRRGKIPGARIGKRWHIPEDGLRQALAGKQSTEG